MSDIDNIIAALNLEYGANRRYEYQIERSPFSQLNAVLEGVRRSEGDHIDVLVDGVKAQQEADPAVGRGFASILTHLRLNLEFEKTANAEYARFAREAEDPDLKKLFQQLALSEAGHIRLFQHLIEQMEGNIYPVAVYCPVCGWEINYGMNPPEGTILRCAQCKVRVELTIEDGNFVPKAL